MAGDDESLLRRVVLPVATEDDVRATLAAFRPYLPAVESVIAVHVIEKAGGAPDKAPLEKRETDAANILAIVESQIDGDVPVETKVAYGTDVVDTLFEMAMDVNASAIVFRPRGGSRLIRLVTSDTSTRLITDPPLPVIALPAPSQ